MVEVRELNPCPKTIPRDFLRAQAIIPGGVTALFPFRQANRHACRSGESHDAWAGQLFPASRTPHQRRLSRSVALPAEDGCL